MKLYFSKINMTYKQIYIYIKYNVNTGNPILEFLISYNTLYSSAFMYYVCIQLEKTIDYTLYYYT